MASAILCTNCNSIFVENTKIPRSPVPHLLGTNLVPSKLESIDIRKTFPDVQTDLSRLDADIVRMETILALLREERKNLQGYMNEHNALLSPARRLLPELWSEIFLRCLPALPDYSEPLSLNYHLYGKTFDVSQAPFLLTQVCSDWRAIALATPKLWAAISFTVASPRHSGSQLALLQTWLTRSGVCPLSLAVIRSDHATPDDAASYWSNYPAIRALISHSRRWENVEIHLPQEPQVQHTFADIRGNLPQLRRLKIWLGAPSSPFEALVLNPFEIAPQLRVLHLNSASSFTPLEVPWAQLTHCSVNSIISTIECLHMLRHCPNLISCVLTCTNTTSPLPSPVSVVQHYQLQKLQLINYQCPLPNQYFDLGELLANLKLPSLCDLNVQSWMGYHSQLLPFISRLPPSLRRLTLKCGDLSDHELIQYLEQTPFLTDLCVGDPFVPGANPAISDKILARLTYAGIDTMLPRLENIDFEGGTYLQNQRFMDMVESRWRFDEVGPVSVDGTALIEDEPRVARLRSIRLFIPFPEAKIDPETLIRLGHFKDEGLDVMVLQQIDYQNSRHLL